MPNCLQPDVATLAKLASMVAHAKELLGPNGHEFDRIALLSLIEDEGVVRWMAGMRELALVSEPR